MVTHTWRVFWPLGGPHICTCVGGANHTALALLRHRMERQYGLAVSVILKAAEVLDVESASPDQRRQAKEVLDAMAGVILGNAAKCVRPGPGRAGAAQGCNGQSRAVY